MQGKALQNRAITFILQEFAEIAAEQVTLSLILDLNDIASNRGVTAGAYLGSVQDTSLVVENLYNHLLLNPIGVIEP